MQEKLRYYLILSEDINNHRILQSCLIQPKVVLSGTSFPWWLTQCMKEHSKKLNPYLFQNYVALYLELYWKQENVADINFWYFIKLKDWAFQKKKNKIFWLTRSKVMPLTSKHEIAADNGMWLTYFSHLE